MKAIREHPNFNSDDKKTLRMTKASSSPLAEINLNSPRAKTAKVLKFGEKGSPKDKQQATPMDTPSCPRCQVISTIYLLYAIPNTDIACECYQDMESVMSVGQLHHRPMRVLCNGWY
eukprot:318946-Rhodomonas_salina.3